MENRSHALMAGIFTIILFLAAALALWWLNGTRELTHTYLLETSGSVTGLNLEAQVRYRGIRAGKVVSIKPDRLDPAILLVEITLDRQYRLTDDTVARLNYQGITGLAYIMLEEGDESSKTGKSDKGDRSGGSKVLDVDGPTPPRIRIQAGLLEMLADKGGMIATQVAELSTRLNRLLDDRNMANIALTLDNLASVTTGLKETPKLLASLRTALSEANLQKWQAILTHLEKAAGAAAPMTVEARNLLATLNGLAQRMDRVVVRAGDVGDRLDAETLPDAAALMAELSAAMQRLDHLLATLNDTPQALLFGAAPHKPGPGESGFVVPPRSQE